MTTTATLSELSVGGKGRYGIGAPAVEYSNNLPTYLRITDINDDGTLNYDGLKSVDDPNSGDYKLSVGDIVFARTGASVGRNYYYDMRDGELIYAGFLIGFSLDANKVNPLWVKYYCQSQQYRDWVVSYTSGSTRGNINEKTFSSLPIPLPPRAYQDQAVALLDSIENQRRSLNRTNRHLHGLMLAKYHELFDSLEVDGTVADLGEVVGGATPSKKNEAFFTESGIGWITPRDLSGTTDMFIAHGAVDITNEGYSSCSTKLMPKGSVLFSSRAPVGYVAIASDGVCTNQGFKSVVPFDEVGTAYVYCFLKENAGDIEKAGSGTTFVEVSGKTMKAFPASIPNVEEAATFSEFANPILDSIENNESERKHLERLRDALLPKLMSGEIDVTEVELSTPPNGDLCE